MFSRRSQIVLALVVLGGLALLFRWADGRARGEPIRIAFAGPVSGASAEDGLSAVRAIELVLESANAAGGVEGRPLALDVYDDANDPERARANATRIADEEHTLAVIGHNFSTCSVAAGAIYAARGLPAVSSAATSVAVTADNPWYFRVIYNDRDQGRFVAAHARFVLGARRLGVIHETQAYGAYLARVVEETAPQAGLALAGRWPFDPEDPRLAEHLARIAGEAAARGGPELLVLAMQPEAGVLLVKALRARGYAGTLLVTDALASQAFADGFLRFPEERARRGFFTDGIYASTPFLFDTGGRLAGDFMGEYVARHGEPPDWYAAFAADAAATLVEALRRAPPEGREVVDRRRALRDALAAIGPLEPVEGITGPTWFDARGDAEKPVPMGRYQNGEVVSALAQLDLVPAVSEDAVPAGRRFELGRQVLRRTDVAQVGVRAIRFGEIDFAEGSFELEFDIWFRHRGDHSVEEVVFTNALEPVELGEPVDLAVDGAVHYRRYRAEGLFRADTLDAPYGGHVMALSLRHRARTRDDLVLAVDPVGMNLGRSGGRRGGAAARGLLAAGSDWTVGSVFVFEEEMDEESLGHPGFLAGPRAFSQLTIGVQLRPQTPSLPGLLPARQRVPLLATAAAGLLLLGVAGGRLLAGPRWLLQLGFAGLALAAAEAVLGNWLRPRVTAGQLVQVSRVFEALWWLLPAFFLNLAVERFVWQRAEARTDTPVPTLLRWFVASLIYVLAVFGIVAFVLDYRLTGLLATSGVLAMVFGLAVQLNITNIFAGIALNLERPFKVGDWIMIHGRLPDPDSSVIGRVTDINWRTTRLQTADDTVIVIPNGVISEKTITNFMGPGEMSRFELTFKIDQGTAPERVLQVIQAALDEVSGDGSEGPLADPRPKVRISKTEDNVVEYKVRYRILPSRVSPLKGRHVVNESVLRHLREAGIQLAYPVRHIREERSAGGGADAPGE